MRGRLWLVMAATALLSAACGGGGGGGAGGGTPADFAGLWTINETLGPNTCGESGSVSYKARVDQDPGAASAEVSIVDDTNTVVLDGPFLASISGSTASWTGSFAEDGGMTTAQINATKTGANSLSGGSNWSWSDGVDSCSGTTTFTGTR